MGVSRVAMIVVLSTILLPSIAMAMEYLVGDENGWGAGNDYQAWAANKIFWVGDTLVFEYVAGEDHVFMVDGPSFQSCTFPPSGGLSSGRDVLLLATPGWKWFIGDHCNVGQKLVITVFFRALPPSDPPVLPPRSPYGGQVPRKLFEIFH